MAWRENIMLYKVFACKTGLPVKETVRQESVIRSIHVKSRDRSRIVLRQKSTAQSQTTVWPIPEGALE